MNHVAALRESVSKYARHAPGYAKYALAYKTAPLVALWIFLVLYPNPFNLLVSVHRVFNPDIDPAAVEPLLVGLPSEAEDIHLEILKRIPYQYDWEVHSMPWYFPKTEDVVANGTGDCKARAIVLASVFERLDVPYRLNSSFVHIWVDYAEKQETAFENPRAKFYEQDPETGKRFFQWPEIEWKLWFDSTVEGLWTVMPLIRKLLMIGGVVLLVVTRVVLRRNTNNSIDNAIGS